MSETERITVVEGPTPTFEPNTEPWVLGMSEGPAIPFTGRCLLRTLDGNALLQRCREAWGQGRAACLCFRVIRFERPSHYCQLLVDGAAAAVI